MARKTCADRRCPRLAPLGQTYCNHCTRNRAATTPGPPGSQNRAYRGTAIWRKLRKEAWERDNGTCRRCGRRITEGQSWDLGHIVPFSQGGPLTLENVRVECVPCNRSHNKPRHRRRTKGHR